MAKKVDKNPKLTYPAGCKELNEELSKDELVKRLKLLARAFQDLGQDDNNDFKELALYLASEFFMDHSSKDVRLLVACCIADIFRVFAPEAPYTEPEHLKEIFMFLTEQLRGLDEPESPSFKRYFYLLENLAWVKSFNICLELEENQEILNGLFKLMFDIISDKHSSKVVGFMLDVMCPLLTEADAVSQDLLDIILACILEPYKTQNRPAYSLARDLIRRSSSAIEPYLQTFFNNALMLGKTAESGLSERLLDLIQELNCIAPAILVSVLPQLEFKLKSGDESERISATRLLAKMFSEPNSDLAMLHKPLWTCFVGRFNDIDINIRRLCTQASQEFIVNHPELVQDVSGSLGIGEHLRQRQHDSDENVRMDVVQAIVGAAKRVLANVTEDLLECVKERTLDKKFKIRKEALIGLGQIYKRCCEVGGSDLERVAWVRNKVLHAYYHNAVDDKVLVERILNTSLVPYSLEPEDRMKRLFLLYTNLDEHAIKALQEIFKTQFGLRSLVRTVLDLHQKGDSDDVNQLLNAKVVQLSRYLSEPQKAQEHLKKFVKIVREDARIRGNLLKLVTPGCSCKKAEDYVKEIIRKMGNPVPQNFLYTNIKQLLERIAPVMIDNSAIVALVTHIEGILPTGDADDAETDRLGDSENLESGMKLLLLLSHVYQSCFHSEKVFSVLLNFVKSDDDIVSDTALQILKNVGLNMEQMFPDIHSTLLPLLQRMAKSGTPKQAKHAIRCIDTLCRNKDAIFKQLYEHLEKSMDLDAPNFLTSLVGIGHLSLLCPGMFASSTSNIVSKFIVKELLMQDRTVSRKSSESWCAEHLVSEETQAKIQGLKMMVRWLLGIRNNANNRASPTMRLLYSMILCEGDLMERGHINKAEMARLRLQAGCCMLKLAQEPVYAEAVRLEQFETMALLVNDPCYEVRVQFVQKLHKGLIALRLPLQYMGVLCLGALDPLKERRAIVKQMFAANVTRRREYMKQNVSASTTKVFSLLPDYVLPYAIHLLAHDPDFSAYDDVNALKGIKDCLVFMIDPLLSKNENISFNFYKKMFENIKQTKDAQCSDSEDANKKLYAICDLALNLIMTKASNFSLTDFPAEPVLPSKLYTQPDLSYPNTSVYLPPEFLSGQANKLKKPVANTTVAPKAPENKKKNATNAAQHDSSRSSVRSRIESPDSSVSSNPSSPVSSTKSSPLGLSERNRAPLTNKLHSARAITKAQGAGKPFSADNNEVTKKRKREDSITSKGDSSIEDVENSVVASPSRAKASKPATAAVKKTTVTKQPVASTTKKKPGSTTVAPSGRATRSDKKLTQGKISDFMRRTSTRGKSSPGSLDRESSVTTGSSSKPASEVAEEEEEEVEDEEEEKEEEEDSEEEPVEKVKASTGSRRQASSSSSSRATSPTKKKSAANTSKMKANTRVATRRVGQPDNSRVGKEEGSSSGPTAGSRKRQRESSQESTQQSGSTKRPRQARNSTQESTSTTAQSLNSSPSKSMESSSGSKRSNNSKASSSGSSIHKRSKSGSLLNGTSDGEEEDESSGSGKKAKAALPSAVLRRRKGVLAIKRREGAAARAAQKYADFEVPVGIITPKKKR